MNQKISLARHVDYGEIHLVNNYEYKVEDIFEDIEGDEKNMLMNIPLEIREQLGWEEGDVLKIKLEEGSIVLEKVENGKK